MESYATTNIGDVWYWLVLARRRQQLCELPHWRLLGCESDLEVLRASQRILSLRQLITRDLRQHSPSLVCGNGDLDVCSGSSELGYSNGSPRRSGLGKEGYVYGVHAREEAQVGEINLDRNCIFEVHPIRL